VQAGLKILKKKKQKHEISCHAPKGSGANKKGLARKKKTKTRGILQRAGKKN